MERLTEKSDEMIWFKDNGLKIERKSLQNDFRKTC